MKTSLATFHDLQRAAALHRRLREAGIAATLRDESKLQRFWFMTEPQAAIHIDVEQPDFLRARQVLVEWEHTDSTGRASVHCPECGSSRVEYPQTTRKFVTPVVLAVLLLLRLLPRKYYCEDCHFTWRKDPGKPDRLDMFPSLRKGNLSRRRHA